MLAIGKTQRQGIEWILFVDYPTLDKTIASNRSGYRDFLLKRRAQIDESLDRLANEEEKEKLILRKIHSQLLALKTRLVICSVVGSHFTESQHAVHGGHTSLPQPSPPTLLLTCFRALLMPVNV